MDADLAAVRAELDRILASPVFAKSPRMSRFLRYVVEQTIEGKSDRIKEYTIAVEVFDKGREFDPQTDSTVRTEATKLRVRLGRYYQTDGAADPIVITIPKGAYVPLVETRSAADRIPQERTFFPRANWIAAAGIALLLAGGVFLTLRWMRDSAARKAAAAPDRSNVAEAQTHYERAGHFDSLGTTASITKAIDEYLLCLTLDPRFAPAHAKLSMAYSRLIEVDNQRFRDLAKLAASAASKAVELDHSLAAGHHAAARAHLSAWNWQAAEPEFVLAMKLDPRNTDISSDYASLYLNMMGRYDEAIDLLRRAVAINPTSRTLRTGIGGALLQAGRYDEAIAAYKNSLELQETPGTLTFIGSALAAQGRYQEAIEHQQRARVLNPTDPWIVSHLAYTFAKSGRTQTAKRHLEELRAMAEDDTAIAVELAGVYSGLGDDERTFLWLKRALEVRSQKLRWVRADQRFRRLHDDERFKALVRTVGLPPPAA
ncbi:MAG TPA: tetratricopeptide repeat protein [Bryobacteraceae bacterium]